MKLTVTSIFCALAAGYVGGLSSQASLFPLVVHAQTARVVPPGTTETRAVREVRAERFVMVDGAGNVRGELKLEKENSEIALYGPNGELTWKAPMGPHIVH